MGIKKSKVIEKDGWHFYILYLSEFKPDTVWVKRVPRLADIGYMVELASRTQPILGDRLFILPSQKPLFDIFNKRKYNRYSSNCVYYSWG